MENYIIYFCVCFIIDFVKDMTLKKLFKLSSNVLEIVFLQILNMSILAIYLFCELEFYQFVLLKILISMVIVLLMTDSYKPSKVFSLFFISNILMFSYFGFYKFFALLARAIIIELFSIKLPYFCDLIINIAIFCYVFAVFAIINSFARKRIINNFLRKVSFLAFGKHINLTGLIDTGNVLYDNKTGCPVVLVSSYSLEKYLPKNTYENITNNNFKEVGFDHSLKLVTVSNKTFDVPILNVKKVIINNDEKSKEFKAVIGIVNHRFENQKNYDCLIHRDLI